MGIVTGQGTTAQMGCEQTWGEKADSTIMLNYTSESLKLNVERKEEETLLVSKTSREKDIMGYSVTGDLSLIAKPINIGLPLAMSLGKESAPEKIANTEKAFKHKFTPLEAGVSVSFPSFTAIIDRHVAAKAYTGLKVGSAKIDVAAKDYMKFSFSLIGKSEEQGLKNERLEIPSLKAFRFAGGTCSFDNVEFGEVTSISIDINNNLDEGEQMLGTGYYNSESQPQAREFKITLDSKYNTKSNTVRDEKYLKESYVNVKLRFESPSLFESKESTDDSPAQKIPYAIEIEMPKVCIDDCSPQVSGKEKLSLSIGGTALESNSEEAITVILIDDQSSKYLV